MKKLTLIVVLLLALLTVGCGSANNSVIQASGQIEATEVTIAPELSGRVMEVDVHEGDSVKSGDMLMHLDDSLLQAQKQQAVAALNVAKSAAASADAALASAQDQYNQTLQVSLMTSDSLTKQWITNRPSDFNVPLWYFTQSEQLSAAQSEADAAQKDLTAAQNNLTSIETSTAGSGFMKIETDLAKAEAAYNVANDLNNRVQNFKNIDQLTQFGLYQLAKQQSWPTAKQNSSDYLINANNIDQNIKDYARQSLDNAKSQLRDAQNVYNDALTSEGAKDVLKARAKVTLEQERYNTALGYVTNVQTGSMSPAVTNAQATLNQAKAADDQAKDAVQQTQASVNLIDTQISKLSVYAPTDGVILTRSIEVGEFIQTGMTAMTLGKLDSMKVTVYIPEDLYGRISLGNQAVLSTDSYPNQTFTAQVTRIADQAEYTPQNVQTKEGRQTTVYAVELSINNTSGKLKPGMPVDVTFESKVATR